MGEMVAAPCQARGHELAPWLTVGSNIKRQATMTKLHYEAAPEYTADAYRIDGWRGIAWSVYGWETQPDEDTDWTGVEERTGKLVCVMVGDDRRFAVDPEDVHPLAAEEYCTVCGQIGCHCNY